jgi:hypothetical protein
MRVFEGAIGPGDHRERPGDGGAARVTSVSRAAERACARRALAALFIRRRPIPPAFPRPHPAPGAEVGGCAPLILVRARAREIPSPVARRPRVRQLIAWWQHRPDAARAGLAVVLRRAQPLERPGKPPNCAPRGAGSGGRGRGGVPPGQGGGRGLKLGVVSGQPRRRNGRVLRVCGPRRGPQQPIQRSWTGARNIGPNPSA